MAQQRTVLLAEDDVEARQVMARYLTSLGVQIIEVDDGGAALEAIQTSSPDLIVLDLNLPAMTGFELCQHVRQRPGTRDIPILVVTGRNSLEDHARAREVGVTKYLSKPFKKRDFLAAVELLLTQQ